MDSSNCTIILSRNVQLYFRQTDDSASLTLNNVSLSSSGPPRSNQHCQMNACLVHVWWAFTVKKPAKTNKILLKAWLIASDEISEICSHCFLETLTSVAGQNKVKFSHAIDLLYFDGDKYSLSNILNVFSFVIFTWLLQRGVRQCSRFACKINKCAPLWVFG